MIKGITRLEHKVGDRVYHFLCENDSPLGEVHDALSIFKSKAVEIMKNADDAEKERQKSAANVDENPIEE